MSTIYELYVTCDVCMLNHVRSWLFVAYFLRPFVVFNGLLDLYVLKCESATVSAATIALVLL